MLNNKKTATLLSLCAFNIGLAIAMGAFGAHGLKSILSTYKLEVFNKACQYLTIQSLGVMMLLILKNTTKFQLKSYVPSILLIGTYIFSVSVGLTAFSELKNCEFLLKAGITAPIGGLLMIIAWLIAALNLFKSGNQ